MKGKKPIKTIRRMQLVAITSSKTRNGIVFQKNRRIRRVQNNF